MSPVLIPFFLAVLELIITPRWIGMQLIASSIQGMFVLSEKLVWHSLKAKA